MKNENAKKKYVRFWKLIFGNSKLGRDEATKQKCSIARRPAAVRGELETQNSKKIRLRPPSPWKEGGIVYAPYRICVLVLTLARRPILYNSYRHIT